MAEVSGLLEVLPYMETEKVFTPSRSKLLHSPDSDRFICQGNLFLSSLEEQKVLMANTFLLVDLLGGVWSSLDVQGEKAIMVFLVA